MTPAPPDALDCFSAHRARCNAKICSQGLQVVFLSEWALLTTVEPVMHWLHSGGGQTTEKHGNLLVVLPDVGLAVTGCTPRHSVMCYPSSVNSGNSDRQALQTSKTSMAERQARCLHICTPDLMSRTVR
jgi:hypothetical protein